MYQMSCHCSAPRPQVPNDDFDLPLPKQSFLCLSHKQLYPPIPGCTATAVCPSSRVLSHSFDKLPGLHSCYFVPSLQVQSWSFNPSSLGSTATAMCHRPQFIGHNFDLPSFGLNCWCSATAYKGQSWEFDPPSSRHYCTLPTGTKFLLYPVIPVPMLLLCPALKVQYWSKPLRSWPQFHCTLLELKPWQYCSCAFWTKMLLVVLCLISVP